MSLRSMPTMQMTLRDRTDRTIAPVAEICPVAVPDLGIWTLYRRGPSGAPVYILGSPAVDRFILVPTPAITVVTAAVELFDGKHSIHRIKEIIQGRYACIVDIMRLYERLSINGLISSPKPAYVESGDIESMSLKLLTIDIRPLFQSIAGAAKTLAPFLALCSIVLILFGCYLELLGQPAPGHGALRVVLQHQKLTRDIPLYYFLLFCSFFFHEFSHGVAATYFGLIPRRLCLALYLGYLPMIYLRIGGTYTLAERQRVVVWLAGPWFNLMFASVCVMITDLGAPPADTAHVLFVAAVANYFMAMVNLLPFLPTDGYFVLVTLMKRTNIRANAWRDLIRWIKREPSQFTAVTAGYLVITITCSVIMLGRMLRSVHSILDMRLWLTVIPIGALIARTIVRRRRRERIVVSSNREAQL
jgi:putative peptide zinc metalloprotease protein